MERCVLPCMCMRMFMGVCMQTPAHMCVYVHTRCRFAFACACVHVRALVCVFMCMWLLLPNHFVLHVYQNSLVFSVYLVHPFSILFDLFIYLFIILFFLNRIFFFFPSIPCFLVIAYYSIARPVDKVKSRFASVLDKVSLNLLCLQQTWWLFMFFVQFVLKRMRGACGT